MRICEFAHNYLTLGAQAQRGGYSVVLCVCIMHVMYVCLSGHAILTVRAIKSIMKDTIVSKRQICGNIKMAFLLIKLSYRYSKVRRFYLPRSAGAAIFS